MSSRRMVAILCALLGVTQLVGQGVLCRNARAAETYRTYLPIVRRAYPPYPEAPVLLPIDNADSDGNYLVEWQPAVIRGDHNSVQKAGTGPAGSESGELLRYKFQNFLHFSFRFFYTFLHHT